MGPPGTRRISSAMPKDLAVLADDDDLGPEVTERARHLQTDDTRPEIVPDRAALSSVRDRCSRVFNLGGTVPPAYWTKVQGDDEAHARKEFPRVGATFAITRRDRSQEAA